MQSKMNLCFSIFLMLMLTQVALSDKNGAKSQGGRVELYKPADDIAQKMGDFLKDLSENSKKLEEKMKELVEEGASDMKNKLDKALKQIYSPENKKKFEDLLNNLPTMKPEDVPKKVEEAMKKLVDQDIPAAKAQIENLANQVQSGEMKKKLQDLAEKMSTVSPADIPKKIAEILKNLGNQGSPAGGKN